MRKHWTVRTSVLLFALVALTLVVQAVTTTTLSVTRFSDTYVTRTSGVLTANDPGTYNIDCGGTTTCPAGTYELSYFMGITAPATAGSSTLVVTAHDGYNSQVITSSTIDTAKGTVTGTHPTSGIGFIAGKTVIVTAGTGHITAGVTVTSATGSPNMQVDVAVKRIR